MEEPYVGTGRGAMVCTVHSYSVPLSTGHPFPPMVELGAMGKYWLKGSCPFFIPHLCASTWKIAWGSLHEEAASKN